MHQLIAYIKFLFRSTNQHGVHSPFVYDLLTKCLYLKNDTPAFQKIRAYWKAVNQDPEIIKVTDFGAGSKVFKSNERKVSNIAKNTGIPIKRALLLNKMVSYFQFKSGLELGTSVGLSSAAIAMENPILLTTLEGCPETAKVAQRYFEEFKLENINLKVGEFDEILDSTFLESSQKFDLIYFDGNHQKVPTLKYFKKLLPAAHNNSVFIFDDIHWSAEMEEAWEEIKAHPSVRVTIDSFYWGLVFFRKEQEKEHFTIRL
ncbi:putative O-methyltransferase YrrM [Gillisia mitskevichiae]|uniref:Putative O-methyltransferase YrrM n=1 Tax=Gillisia mitskevichiae TaxID=270921 RepID=A0A495P3M5_9FLAO|nr:class I SAM-dependent methyltransferase [Gillisia mitskevichiae]RKS45113.1 putative O-methyltransferase YrrM [Gillisia mitskevichiae]